MPKSEPSASDWAELCTGPNANVWIHSRCLKEMDTITQKDRAKIRACMQDMYCTMENVADIPQTKMNRNEGRHGPKKLLVQAFKSFQGRVYGIEGSIKGKRTFFATNAAVKKDDKADPADLKRATERIAGVLELRGMEV